MPLHMIYARKGLFDETDKRELSEAITKRYVERAGLPAFYVVVIFHDVEAENMYIGGLNHKEREAKVGVPFVRIVVQHLARSHESREARLGTVQRLDTVYHKHIKDRGWEYELSIEEPPADYWLESGIRPPAPGTDAERKWVELDRAVPHNDKTMAEYFAEKKGIE